MNASKFNSSKAAVRKILKKNADEKYKNFIASLNPGIENILGVRAPIIKKLAKEILQNDWQKYLADKDVKYSEELLLEAIVTGCANVDYKEKLALIKSFIPKINGWAVCDTFCSSLEIPQKNLPDFFKFCASFINSKNEYDVRFCVVSLLCLFCESDYAQKSLEVLNKFKHKAYYAQMGAAWAVSIIFIKNQELTYKFLEKNSLDDFTHNKSIQKIRESLRIEKSVKDSLLALKKSSK